MQIHNCEQNSSEWYDLRSGRPTASEFKKIITGTGKASTQAADYAALLAAELYAGGQLERWEGNQWTERGHELEPEAKAAYTMLTTVQIEQVGFVTNDIAGCSPDGLVGEQGLFEGKCLSPHKHVLALDYFHRNGKPQPDYIPQCQGQIWITERAWADLFFYHPQLPTLQIRVHRDQAYIDTLAGLVSDVIVKRDRFGEMLEAA